MPQDLGRTDAQSLGGDEDDAINVQPASLLLDFSGDRFSPIGIYLHCR